MSKSMSESVSVSMPTRANGSEIAFAPAVVLIGQIVDLSSFYVLLPLSCVSLPCELIAILVFYRSSLGVTATTRIYYIFIGLGELLTTVFKEILFYAYGIGLFAVDGDAKLRGQWTPLGDSTWCPLTVFLWSFGETVANNALLAFTAEVVVASYLPLRAKIIITKRHALIGMSFLVVEAALVNLMHLRQFAALRSPALSCGYICMPLVDYESWGTALFAVNYMLPALVGLVLTALVVRKVRYASRSRSRKRNSRHDLTETGSPQTMRRNEMTSCLTLVCMSVAHFLFCLPLTVFRIMYSLGPLLEYSRSQSAIFVASSGLVYMVQAPVHLVNFAIYCRRIPHFRTSVLRLLSCRKLRTRAISINTDLDFTQSQRS